MSAALRQLSECLLILQAYKSIVCELIYNALEMYKYGFPWTSTSLSRFTYATFSLKAQPLQGFRGRQ